KIQSYVLSNEGQAKLAEKRAKAQQEHFDERKAQETNEFDEDLFEEIEYETDDEVEDIEDIIDDTLASQEMNQKVEDAVEETKEEVVEEVDDAVVEESDLERAARIAKEKKAKEGIDIASKQEYVSKFESLAGASKTTTSTTKKKKKQVNVEEEIERKPTFDLKKEYDMKPIYSEEELEEIARREEEERENDWINDDIDFDEFDKYYD
ncbi:MAG: transcription termination/antitermination protein NusA, partial [Traorella sp.]